ncbi:hypothetical protein M569_11246, partial [Genlisea aurea]
SPPRPLLIFTPTDSGFFPVLIFLHGFLLYNSFYSQLLHHVASHGFIVVAPQLYSLAGPDATQEVRLTAEITEWMSSNQQLLSLYLPPGVKPDMARLALSGHSRGGKVAFALALSSLSSSCPKFSAIIGVDPVDGMDKGSQTSPPVLTYIPKSFQLNGTAVMIIGTGLGEERRNPLFPACAPRGVNHEDFYKECRKPSYYFVGKDYGHMDVLDDETNGIRGKASYCLCKNGESRGPMRRFVGGVLVAFLKAYLRSDGDDDELVGIRQG